MRPKIRLAAARAEGVEDKAFRLYALPLTRSLRQQKLDKRLRFRGNSRIAWRVTRKSSYSSKAYGGVGVERGVGVVLGVAVGLTVAVAVGVGVVDGVTVGVGVILPSHGLTRQSKLSIESVGSVGA